MIKKISYYKYCIVPCCTSTSVNTPEKNFFHVPHDPLRRKAWTYAMKRDDILNKKLSPKSSRWCCEDHFVVKTEFFKYFQMGLSVRDAKKKFTEHYKHKKLAKKTKNSIPTIIQTEFLYKEWQRVKDDGYWQYKLSNTLKEGIWTKSKQGTISFKEFLDVVPKRENMHSIKHLDISTESDKNALNQDIKFPLVFVSVGSVKGMPGTTAPLLYKLKHGISGDLVSNLVSPRIYSLSIETENSFEPVSNEILGIPTSVDESCVSVEAASKYTLDIPIKLEPLNDGYEDIPTQGSIETLEDTFILPTPIQAFSCKDATTERIDIKANICSGDTTTTEEIDIKPNICKADNSFFPLVFTLKGSVYETSKSRSLVYDLKQSSSGVSATEVVLPQISSVQINSLHEAAFQFKDSSMLTAEGPLNITLQTELLEVNSNTAFSINGVDAEDIPVIINSSSCSDHFPVITD